MRLRRPRFGLSLSELRPVLFALVAFAPAKAATPLTESGFASRVDELRETGQITWEEGLLLQFQRVFAPGELPDGLRSVDAIPTKSATGLVWEFERMRGGLSIPVRALIEGYLAPRSATNEYVTAHFRFAYDTIGEDAVPSDDLDASGVPDFVERAGAWAETSRTTFRNAGFASPVGRDGLVDVEFRAMNAYGLTRIVGGFPVISLHNDFLGFPDNSDPEGSDRGAAKVTIAHETKHASQYAASGWTEGGWLEADATWAEDFVFDQVDDYVRYVAERSPVSNPDSWLPAGYGACVWQHLLEQRHGVELLKEFFDRRSAMRQEDARESFEFALNAYGSDVATEARELGLWSYFCGANSGGKPMGFDEAAAWPTPPYVAHVVEPSATRSGRLGGLESHYLLIQAGDRIGSPVLALTGAGAARCSMSALLLRTSGVREVIPVPVDGTGAALELPCEWSDLAMLAVVITNRDAFSPETEWFVTIDVDGAVDVLDPEAAVPFALAAPRPNPFRGSTALAFSLPRESDVRLAVFDVSGRLVRRLIDGERLPAGPHERRWDGTDEVGRTAAPGVYYYRLQSGEYSDSRRMLLLR